MKAKRFLTSGMIAAVFLMLLTGLTFAQAPDATPLGTGFTYQGELLSGGTRYSGTCDFKFGLYDVATMGTSLGELSVTNVTVSEGIFTAQLDFGSDEFTGDNRWLGISVRCPAGSGTYQQLLPRQPLTAAPYAMALPGLWTQPNSTSPNLIGGKYTNWVTSGVVGATISGGGEAGYLNRVTDNFSTVSGGRGNQAGDGDTDLLNGRYATVGGGLDNTASGAISIVGGGFDNSAIGGYSTVGGGAVNLTINPYSTVCGGTLNLAGGPESTVSGGYSNDANGTDSTIGGGWENTASGFASSVGGGDSNTSSGEYSTIPGGSVNIASGNYSFAAGRGANAQHPGSFVWADSQGTTFYSPDDNTFNIRAENGVNVAANSVTRPGEYVYNMNDTGASAGDGTAILGRSNSDYGYGVAGWNYVYGVGVGAWSYDGNLIEAYDGDYPGGVLRFYVDQDGNLHYDGTASTFAEIPSPTDEGSSHVSLYGISAAEAWYEDLGSANLLNGKVTITIDPIFAQTVSLSQEYQVQVTATCGEPVLLFVSEKTERSFTVQGVSLDGKPSNCGFDYRISAKPLGYEGLRLEAIDIPEPIIVDRELP